MQHPDTAPHRCLISDVLVDVRVAISSDKLTGCRWLGTKRSKSMTHDTRVADWLGHSGASVKTGRFRCEIHSLSLEVAVIDH